MKGLLDWIESQRGKPNPIGAMLDPQFRQEMFTGGTDAVNRGAIAGTIGAPVDALTGVLNAGVMGAGYLGNKAGLLSADQMPQPVTKPFMGSEYVGDKMNQAGFVSENRNPVAETLTGLLAPAAMNKGAKLMWQGEQNLSQPGLLNTPAFAGQRGAIVYHGSPHKFDKFDMDKIGTGEGAQAYGHGLYFAEEPRVAKGYQRALSDNELLIDGKNIPLDSYGIPDFSAVTKALNLNSRAASIAINDATGNRSLQSSVKSAQRTYKKGGDTDLFGDFSNNIDARKSIADDIRKAKKTINTIGFKQGGAFYKVDIPDESIPRMLDWDKRLNEQHPDVQNILSKNYKIEPYTADGLSPNLDGAGIYKALMGFEGMPPYDKLKQLGIPGIRYLDGNSRGSGGTSNYVLFDDQLPRILEKNGQPTGLLSYADEAKKAKVKK